MLQQLYYIKQHVGAHLLQNGILKPYISLLRKITVVIIQFCMVLLVYTAILHIYSHSGYRIIIVMILTFSQQ